MSERVLITGASGFIGYHLVQAALQQGFEVHAAVRPSSETSELKQLGIEAEVNKRGKLLFVFPDFTSAETLLPLMDKGAYSYVIHAAGVTRAKSTEAYNEVNANYTLRLAQASLACGLPLKRFVFLSSLAAVGSEGYHATSPISEDTVPKPLTSYGKSKMLAESYLVDLKDLPLTTIRPTAVYGPREKDILILFQTLNKGLDLYIGRKPQWLSFVHVTDLVAATLAAFKEDSKLHTAYNISDGNKYDRYKLADLFRKFSKKSPNRLHVPLGVIKLIAAMLEAVSVFSKNAPVLNQEKIAELTAENWYCSIDKAQKNLGYEPKFGLEDGLKQTLTWYKENKWL
ncbi:NAD(P)-dependent oxidoreductase [Dyadobacter sp. CY312]|uniref:NAD-dependent epimerase/dehydratase family protein n=1 Tax=Dyadobacter sp. CY312 TaxID=2907303 RepID=UPI001F3CC533|nr:NAD(P)-dependent oxidoreductase [Dyadobacter sp. CY312]MCE7043244.1 NAD(P)-dependent oxidoreductase [Dyadobacter sp. CY312]